jgi:hypothetical protein
MNEMAERNCELQNVIALAMTSVEIFALAIYYLL